MLIPFDTLVSKYGIKPTGVFHVGASIGQEIPDYAKYVSDMIFVEAIPAVFVQLVQNLPSDCGLAFNECLLDVDGEERDFNIATNEGQSSSLLQFGTHAKAHPEVRFTGTIKVRTKRGDTMIKENDIDLTKYDFLNVDVQGVELEVLKGMGKELTKINYAYIEVNKEELYRGCALVGEIDEYLLGFGLHPIEKSWTPWAWGDAFYSRTNGTS